MTAEARRRREQQIRELTAGMHEARHAVFRAAAANWSTKTHELLDEAVSVQLARLTAFVVELAQEQLDRTAPRRRK